MPKRETHHESRILGLIPAHPDVRAYYKAWEKNAAYSERVQAWALVEEITYDGPSHFSHVHHDGCRVLDKFRSVQGLSIGEFGLDISGDTGHFDRIDDGSYREITPVVEDAPSAD